MTTDVVTVVLDPGEITIGHCQVEGSWASSSTGPTRVPLSLPAETPAGEPVLVEGLLERVGDPVPLRVASTAFTGAELVARAVTDAVREVVGEGAHHLVVVVPQDWLAHRSTALRRELAATVSGTVEIQPAAVTLLPDAPVGETRLVVRVATTVTAALCTRGPAGWSATRTAHAPWGSGDLDDELLGYVRERSLDSWTREQGWAARRACGLAREELTERTSTEVLLPGGEQVRLVRADLSTLAGDALDLALDQVVTDIGDVEEETGVVLTGSLATHPFVTEAVTRATGRPVEPLGWSGVCSAHALAATPPAAPEQPASGPEVEGLVLPLPDTTRGRHRRKGLSAITLVGAGAAAALIGGVAVAGVGEAPLNALLSTVTPGGDEPASEDTDTVSAPTTGRGGHPADAMSATALPAAGAEPTEEATPRPTSTAGGHEVPVGESAADEETSSDGAVAPSASAPGSDRTTTDETKGADAPTETSSTSSSTDGSPAPERGKKTGTADEHPGAHGEKTRGETARGKGPKGSPPGHSRARSGGSEQTPTTRAGSKPEDPGSNRKATGKPENRGSNGKATDNATGKPEDPASNGKATDKATGKPEDPGSNGSDGSGTTPPTPSGTTDPTEAPSSPVGTTESQNPDGAMADPSLDQ